MCRKGERVYPAEGKGMGGGFETEQTSSSGEQPLTWPDAQFNTNQSHCSRTKTKSKPAEPSIILHECPSTNQVNSIPVNHNA